MNARERELREMVAAFGGALVKTNGGHWKATLPNGEFCFMSGTPSDARALDNARAQLQRAARRRTVPAPLSTPSTPPAPPPAAPVPLPSQASNTENTENDKEEPMSNEKNKKDRKRGDFTALTWEERIRRREWFDDWCRQKISAGEYPGYPDMNEAMRSQFGATTFSQILKEARRRALLPKGAVTPSDDPRRRWAVNKIVTTPKLTTLQLRRMLSQEFQASISVSEVYDYFLDAGRKPYEPTREERRALIAEERSAKARSRLQVLAATTSAATAATAAAAAAPAAPSRHKKGGPDEAVNAALKMLLEEISNLKGLTVQVATDGQVDVSYELYETRTTTFRVK